jgi:anti-sigma factor RsiW
MTRCPESRRIQDLLDGALAPAAAAALRAHIAGCADCAAERARYERVFAALARIPEWTPSPALTARVLRSVLPSEVRRRRLRAFGWGYAGALALVLGAVTAWGSHPGSTRALESLSGEASRRLAQAGVFVLNSITHGAVHFADAWGLVAAAGERLSPLQRVVAALMDQPVIALTMSAAFAVCAGMLWWMRPRPRAVPGEVRHVGVVGF